MLSRALFWKEMRDARWIIVVGLVIAVLTGVSLPLLFDYLAGLMSGVPLPEWVRGTAEAQTANYRLYIWSNWYGKNLSQYVLVLAVIIGATALAGERGRGSLEFTLTRPLSRGAVFATKVAAGAAALAIIVVVSTVATLVSTLVAGRAVDPWWFLGGLAAFLAGSLTLHALALVFSARMVDAVKAGVAAIVVALVLTVPGYFPATTKYSLFYHMASGKAAMAPSVLAGGAWVSVLVLAAAAAALYYAAFRLFEGVDF